MCVCVWVGVCECVGVCVNVCVCACFKVTTASVVIELSYNLQQSFRSLIRLFKEPISNYYYQGMDII